MSTEQFLLGMIAHYKLYSLGMIVHCANLTWDDCPLSKSYSGWLSTGQNLFGMIVHWVKLAQDDWAIHTWDDCPLSNSYFGW